MSARLPRAVHQDAGHTWMIVVLFVLPFDGLCLGIVYLAISLWFVCRSLIFNHTELRHVRVSLGCNSVLVVVILMSARLLQVVHRVTGNTWIIVVHIICFAFRRALLGDCVSCFLLTYRGQMSNI